jgi:ring-1,2-phenylacetyl-CoA epoxidase subunit PaaC
LDLASLPPIDDPEDATGAGVFDTPAALPRDGVRFEVLLRLGDDALVLGQRLGEWCGHGPVLEVDISLANLSLDLVGQATLLLNEAGACEGKGRDGDQLAFHRDVLDFRNCQLVEQPNGDFAQSIARHLLYSTWQHMLLQRLQGSRDTFIREFAHKAVKEIAYHRELSNEWTIRLGDGTEESSRRMARGLDWNWRFMPELFEVDETLKSAIECGVAADPREFEHEYRAAISSVLFEARLEVPPDQRPILGGRRGHHSEHLGHLLATMQFLPRTYPDAKW